MLLWLTLLHLMQQSRHQVWRLDLLAYFDRITLELLADLDEQLHPVRLRPFFAMFAGTYVATEKPDISVRDNPDLQSAMTARRSSRRELN